MTGEAGPEILADVVQDELASRSTFRRFRVRFATGQLLALNRVPSWVPWPIEEVHARARLALFYTVATPEMVVAFDRAVDAKLAG